MPTPRSAYYMVDLGIKESAAVLVDTDVVEVGGIVPVSGTIKEIWAGVNELPTTGTLGVYKSAATNVNLISATTLNLATGLTANTASSLTLASGLKTREVTAGNILRATWTLTNITHDNNADDSGYACIVIIEPNVW